VSDAAREAGLLLNSPRPETLRFMPALTTSAAEIDAMLEILDGALRGVLGR
jgi:acetylornithine/N-succinyldiaminopimelate aminotransferase